MNPEESRLKSLYVYEAAARKLGYRNIAGIDEAGRGSLFGPVVAAACMIPEGLWIAGVNDSKKLSKSARQKIFEQIQKANIPYALGIVSAEEIDRINIYQATTKAMILALQNLSSQPDYILVDGGTSLAYGKIPCKKIIRGDSLSYSIAAASIIAKESRDAMMLEFHEKYPDFGLNTHMGYATEKHLAAIQMHGPTQLHRFSFEPMKSMRSNDY